jgi:MFS family permease
LCHDDNGREAALRRGRVLGEATAGACLPGARRWVLAATILGSSMAFIDSSAVNVVLPIAMAAGPVSGGWLASTFSWRWVFCTTDDAAAATTSAR